MSTLVGITKTSQVSRFISLNKTIDEVSTLNTFILSYNLCFIYLSTTSIKSAFLI